MLWQRLWVDRFMAIRDLYASATYIIPKHKVEKNIRINTTMDLNVYQPYTFETKKIPVLIHAPSKMNIKGTVYVEKIDQELWDIYRTL